MDAPIDRTQIRAASLCRLQIESIPRSGDNYIERGQSRNLELREAIFQLKNDYRKVPLASNAFSNGGATTQQPREVEAPLEEMWFLDAWTKAASDPKQRSRSSSAELDSSD